MQGCCQVPGHGFWLVPARTHPAVAATSALSSRVCSSQFQKLFIPLIKEMCSQK